MDVPHPEKHAQSLPFDIENDRFVQQAQLCCSDDRIQVIIGNDVVREFSMDEMSGICCEADVGCGKLVATVRGQDVLICRFTLKYLDGFSRFAKQLSRSRGWAPSAELPPSVPAPEKTERPHVNKRTTLSRVYALCRPYMFKLMLAGSLMILASLCTVYYQQIQKKLIDSYLEPAVGTMNDVLPLFLILFALAVGTIALTIGKNTLCTSLGSSMANGLRMQLFGKVQSLSMSFINRVKPGVIIHRVTRDTDDIREFMEFAFGQITSNLFTMVLAFVAMCLINWKLALVTVVFAPFCVVFIRMFQRRMHRMFRNQARKGDNLNAKLQDMISGIRVIKVFGKEKRESDCFTDLADEYAKIQSENEAFWAVIFPVLTILMGLGSVLVYYFGGQDILDGTMTVGTLIQFASYTAMLYQPMRWIARLPRLIVRMLTAVNRVYEVLQESPDVVYPQVAEHTDIRGDIEFRHVSFGYETGHEVLSDINLTVKSGEMIGLVGSSGVGKSTAINLIMRLYDVGEGELLIDGKNIKTYDKNDLHNQIGVVLQETFLFAGTILDNLRFVKPDASYDQLISACKLANAHDFICRLPDGYNTYIGERGYTLSGGERQRIAIARALLCDPRILILDEATSSLDTKNEMLIQDALRNLCQGRTTIAIAHRLSTLRNADRIVVLDRHRVAEVGSHQQLMQQDGIYHSLVTAQAELHSVKKVDEI